MNTNIQFPIQFPDNESQGYMNARTKEWHSEDGHMKECHVSEIEQIDHLTWGEAKEKGADLCGHEYKELSQHNDTKPKRKVSDVL